MKEIIKDNMITLTNDNGDEKEFEIMLTYTNEETKKTYVFYYDPLTDSDDVQVYTGIYDEENKEIINIEDDKEFEEIEEVYNAFIEEQGLSFDE